MCLSDTTQDVLQGLNMYNRNKENVGYVMHIGFDVVHVLHSLQEYYTHVVIIYLMGRRMDP